MNEILEALNPVQREAVLHPEGPLLIFAGAGSGKTRVLTHRVAYLVRERGVDPTRILAVTFTNKAANEMRERILSLVGGLPGSLWIGTFHALSARFLRIYGHHIGLDRDFVIYDDQDQEAVVKECLKALSMDEKRHTPRSVLGAISRAKEQLIGPEEYAHQVIGTEARAVARVYPEYELRLRRNNALDFDDLISFAVRLFRDCTQVRDWVQGRFEHVLVDEFQDINKSQYVWTRLIAERTGNLVVVGDDDQSIYSWRGADVRLIQGFAADYPSAKVVMLEQNYRSTQTILDAAYHVICRNRSRADKRLWTEHPAGQAITIHEADSERGEAIYVSTKISQQVTAGKRHYRDFAILYRMNSQSRPFEDELRRAGVPYRMVGGLRFYERKEVKDLLACLRVVANPADSVSLRRMLGALPLGIGATTLARAQAEADRHGTSLFEALRHADRLPEITAGIRKRVHDLIALVEELREVAQTKRVADLVKTLLDRTSFLQTLEGKTTTETQSRRENVQEMLRVALEFSQRPENNTLSAFLEEMALVSDIDSLRDDEDGVAMMTLHAAKGLEFPVVFIPGMEEGIFPHSRTLASEEQLEEERRLCYVGITRAREELFLLHAYQRIAWGFPQRNPASRFLDDIPEELVTRRAIADRLTLWADEEDEEEEEPADPKVTERRPAATAPASRPGFGIDVSGILAKHRPAPAAFGRGDKVRHPTFGDGIVLDARGQGPAAEITVHFSGGIGTKKLLAEFARLEKA